MAWEKCGEVGGGGWGRPCLEVVPLPAKRKVDYHAHYDLQTLALTSHNFADHVTRGTSTDRTTCSCAAFLQCGTVDGDEVNPRRDLSSEAVPRPGAPVCVTDNGPRAHTHATTGTGARDPSHPIAHM